MSVYLNVIRKTQVGFEGEWRVWSDTTMVPIRTIVSVQAPVGAVVMDISPWEKRILWTPPSATPGRVTVISVTSDPFYQFVDEFVLNVIENQFFFDLPDGFGGEVSCELAFELDLSVEKGAITPERFVSLFDVIDIQRTIGYADQDVQSRVIVSPSLTLALELLSQSQSDVANFFAYFRDAVKRVRFKKNDVLVFRGEQNIEHLEQRGELSLVAYFDGASAAKLREPFKNGKNELNPSFNQRYASYEEVFGFETYYKVNNLFRAIAEDFGFDGYSIEQNTIRGFLKKEGDVTVNFAPPIPVAADFGGPYPVYVDKRALFGLNGVLYSDAIKTQIKNLGDALKNFATWLDLVVEFDSNNRCEVRSFWDTSSINLSDDDVIAVEGKQNGVKKLDFVVATGFRNDYSSEEADYFMTNAGTLNPNGITFRVRNPTIYGISFGEEWWFERPDVLFLDENRNKIISRLPFFVSMAATGIVQVFGIYVPFTVVFPEAIEVNTGIIEFQQEPYRPIEFQSIPSLVAASAWQLYKKNREKITLRLRGTDWRLSRNYETSPTSRVGEYLKLKPLEFKIDDGAGETEATFLNIT